MCFISSLQAELGRGDPSGCEARAVAVLSRGCRSRPTRHQAEPEMLARAERPRPGPRPPPVSPFPPPPVLLLLLLLAMLGAPVCGRVPRSVPRTSLPISGKTQGPLSSTLAQCPALASRCPHPPALLTPAAASRAPQHRAHFPETKTEISTRCLSISSHSTPSHPTYPTPNLSSHLSSQDITKVLLKLPFFNMVKTFHTWILRPGVCPRL